MNARKRVKSPLPWIGGKYYMTKKLAPLLPPHVCYCEPFAGAAHMLFAKPAARLEVLNDINGELVNFWRVVRHHKDEFCRCFSLLFPSRDEFFRLREVNPDTLTDIQRAARFFYLQKWRFGGSLNASFSIRTARPKLRHSTVADKIDAVSERLVDVVIEHLPYADAISRYDTPDTVFYIDPPYFGHETEYGNSIFAQDDFAALAALLAGIKGKFLLSINDTPEMRDTFSAFYCQEIDTLYANVTGGGRNRAGHELVFTNFEICAAWKQAGNGGVNG